MIAQSTLISYHTEAFVKTEVAFTVAYSAAGTVSARGGGSMVAASCTALLLTLL